VCHGGEFIEGSAANPLGGRILSNQGRIPFLQPLQLTKKLIVLGVGNCRGIQDIILPVVVLQPTTKLINPFSGTIFRADGIKKR
jgi:hypothetical protein